jgi:hypothetical protein
MHTHTHTYIQALAEDLKKALDVERAQIYALEAELKTMKEESQNRQKDKEIRIPKVVPIQADKVKGLDATMRASGEEKVVSVLWAPDFVPDMGECMYTCIYACLVFLVDG